MARKAIFGLQLSHDNQKIASMRKSVLRVTIAACLVLFLQGCKTTSHVLVGETRTAITPAQVLIYSEFPENYQEIALLTSSSKMSMAFSDQAQLDLAIERMKKEAAELGANGIVLQSESTEGGPDIGIGSGGTIGRVGIGTGISFQVKNKILRGLAIYVEQTL